MNWTELNLSWDVRFYMQEMDAVWLGFYCTVLAFTPFGCEGICCDWLGVRGGRRDKQIVLRSNKSHTSLYGHRDFCMDARGLAKDNHGVLVHLNAEQDDFRWNTNWKQTVTSSKYLTQVKSRVIFLRTSTEFNFSCNQRIFACLSRFKALLFLLLFSDNISLLEFLAICSLFSKQHATKCKPHKV